MHKKYYPFLFFLGLFFLVTSLRAEILIDAFGTSAGLDAWTVSGKGDVSINDGKITIIADNNDANPKLTTQAKVALAQREKISLVIRNASHAVAYNHAAGGLDIGIDGTVLVRLTTWGDGSGVIIGNTLIPFESPPVASKNISLELSYDSVTRNLVVRQFGGSAKSGGEWKSTSPAAPLILLDKTLDKPLVFPDQASLVIFVRSQYNGGTTAKGTSIDGLRLEAN